jgi:glutamate/tyrosine decarboxylase-like PLP-dependent enzyme
VNEITIEALRSAASHAHRYISLLDVRPVATPIPANVLRERFARTLGDQGIDPVTVINELVESTEGAIMGSAGGRFFAWVVGGSLSSALAADWLTAAWDQNAAIYACSPAAAVVEEIVGQWIKSLLDLPERASFALTTGCQMAHLTCLAAARHALLERRGWDVERQGLSQAPRIRIVATNESHGSVERAVRLLGMGSESILKCPVNEKGQMSAESLKDALVQCEGCAVILLLQAGDLNIGAFDPFSELIPFARRAGAWVHIDGAFGLWAGASPRYRRLLEGVSLADSWATDAHKWLNVPYDSGIAVIADAGAHSSALSYRASYLAVAESGRDQIDWNPEWSRRARGFALYAALRELGRLGIADLVERCCEHTTRLVESIGALPSVEILWRPTLNQGLVRFLDSGRDAIRDDHARRTDAVIAKIAAGGEAFFGGVTWRNYRAMRISVCNWRTTANDIDRAIAAVGVALNAV